MCVRAGPHTSDSSNGNSSFSSDAELYAWGKENGVDLEGMGINLALLFLHGELRERLILLLMEDYFRFLGNGTGKPEDASAENSWVSESARAAFNKLKKRVAPGELELCLCLLSQRTSRVPHACLHLCHRLEHCASVVATAHTQSRHRHRSKSTTSRRSFSK